jgi:hypothetical protein
MIANISTETKVPKIMGEMLLWEVAAGGAEQNYPKLRTSELSC